MKKIKREYVYYSGILLLFMICVIFPLYLEEGYYHLSDSKFDLYRQINIICIPVCILFVGISCLNHRKKLKNRFIDLAGEDWCLIGFFLSVTTSYLLSEYKENAFWGIDGWYMGTFTQWTLIGLFLIARYAFFYCKKESSYLYGIILGTVILIMILGCLHRFGIYPFEIPGKNQGFLSTVGNINWYCGYLSVFVPSLWISMTYSENKYVKILSGIGAIVSVVTLLTQGTQGGCFVLLCSAGFACAVCLCNGQVGKASEETGIAFLSGCAVIRILFLITKEEYESNVYQYFCHQDWPMILLGIIIIIKAVQIFYRRRAICHCRRNDQKKSKIDRNKKIDIFERIIICFLLAECFFIFLVGVYGSVQPDQSRFTDLFNGRGGIWRDAVMALSYMDVREVLFGAGADCFYCYLYDIDELRELITAQFLDARLTCAHSEPLNIMINFGVIGCFFYFGFFIFMIKKCFRFLKENDSVSVACMLSGIFCYLGFHMTSFSQILSTPFVFILSGAAQGLIKESGNDKMINCLEAHKIKENRAFNRERRSKNG